MFCCSVDQLNPVISDVSIPGVSRGKGLFKYIEGGVPKFWFAEREDSWRENKRAQRSKFTWSPRIG